jgi:hypothetical protein
MPQETREQWHARRLATAEMRQREQKTVQAQELAGALQHQVGNVRRIDEVCLDALLVHVVQANIFPGRRDGRYTLHWP